MSQESKTPNIDSYLRACEARGKGQPIQKRDGKYINTKTGKEVESNATR